MTLEKIKIDNVVQKFGYYDSGLDYYMDGVIYWDSIEQKFKREIWREGDFNLEVEEASDEIKKKWKEHLGKIEEVISKFQNITNLDCPVCGGKMKLVKNQKIKRILGTKKDIWFCPHCLLNLVKGIDSITETRWVKVYKNFKLVDNLYLVFGKYPDESLLVDTEKINNRISEFLSNITKAVESNEVS